MTLTKADFVQTLSDNIGLNKREAPDLVEALFEEITRALETGDAVKLAGFAFPTVD